jgi:hypothetical protein
MVAYVQRLQREHIQMEHLWAAVEPMLVRWSDDTVAMPTATERRDIEAFRLIYPEHIALEEKTVFPAGFVLLGPEGSILAGAEMQARRKVGHNPAGARANTA